MTKGINPLYISALDILLNTLGVFIILNFLNARLAGPPPVPEKTAGKEQKEEPKKPIAAAQPRPAEPRAWWRKPAEPQPPVQQPATPVTPQPNANPDPQPATPQTTVPPNSAPQDPVAVDLMKQTKGAVTILLQQADQAKASVEFMLRQGNQTWKPSRASKYQNSEFQYEKALTYFHQSEIHPGTYEVLVRVKKGQKGAGQKTFGLFGKIIPPGGRTQTYNFGTFGLNGAAGEWVSAGSFHVTPGGLSYQSRLPAATARPQTGPDTPAQPTATKPAPEPVRGKPSGRGGKWG